jgi:integrase/recombinase XerD
MSQPSFHLIDLIDQFLSAKTAAGLSPKTIRTYRERLARFAAWLGDRPLSRANLRGYLLALQQEQLAPTTVAVYFRDVSILCGWLVEEGVLRKNPARKLVPKLPKLRPAHYTVAHVQRLLQVCSCPGHDRAPAEGAHAPQGSSRASAPYTMCCMPCRDRAIIIALVDTGLRASEFCSLRRDRIDWASGKFVVLGKGRKERAGWFSAGAVLAIQAYLSTRTDDHVALWYGRWGPLTPRGVHHIIKRRAIEAGIRGDVRRCLHAFRATFAWLYLARGGDLGSLADHLGHSTLEMARHYGQLADEELAKKKAAINPLAAILED